MKENDMILFRADGNPKIGTGHIMRCLSLADAFRERGTEAVFILAEPYMRPLVQGRGYECLILGFPYDRLEEELPALLPLLEERRPVCVVLDSYFAAPEYMAAVRARAPLVYLDDLNAFDYPVDMVVNYNLYGETTDYPPNKTYLLGPRYAPLRKQFQGLAPRLVRDRAERFLISTGGTDPYHVALRCVEYLREHPPDAGTVYHVVLGVMNRDVEKIRETAAGLPYIALHRQVADMGVLMLRCDMAVSAGGTTLYELCASGLPTITYILADNQIQGAAAFEAAGLMPCAGDIRRAPGFAGRIFAALKEAGGLERRRKTAERMQALVDGNGSDRLAGAIARSFPA